MAKAILKTFTNAKLSFTTRCLAAEALGRLKFTGGGGIDAVDSVALLGQFIADACKNELESAKATEFSVSRRRMKYRTNAVLTALLGSKDAGTKGIAGLLRDPAQQAYAADLQKTLDSLMENLDDKGLEPSDLEKRVDETRAAVEDWLTKKPK